MSVREVSGHVREVKFMAGGRWFFSVFIDEALDDDHRGWYQIDHAAMTWDGEPATAAECVRRLAALFDRDDALPLPRAVLKGAWGPDTYEVAHSADFFSPDSPSPKET